MTNKPPSTRAVNNRPRRRRREGLAAGAMPNETWPALVDPAGDATCSSTDAPLRRSPGGAAFIQDLLERAGPTTDGWRHLPSRLARTPDVIQDPSLQRLCVRSDSRTDVLVVATISLCGLQLPSSCRCRLSGLVFSLGVSISSDRDTAAKPPGHA